VSWVGIEVQYRVSKFDERQMTISIYITEKKKDGSSSNLINFFDWYDQSFFPDIKIHSSCFCKYSRQIFNELFAPHILNNHNKNQTVIWNKQINFKQSLLYEKIWIYSVPLSRTFLQIGILMRRLPAELLFITTQARWTSYLYSRFANLHISIELNLRFSTKKKNNLWQPSCTCIDPWSLPFYSKNLHQTYYVTPAESCSWQLSPPVSTNSTIV
jgi:hypothetical protein